ncbi:hypothetical protein SAMN02910298_01280 [Pseudobutyrivibrio sp. YE44]|uniref:DUF5067 domain-containing protein n=1 Tax=Pseudobutyrivibrio sp. YE44 TaxID=1520802 RepID=UPI00087F035E|nr:DUF5067 domain-containing protein [Pseudobutyrivibrio sp. YE44]SDB25452.1 hypothetical protein SAMN02910298_01280 [Pseudobutyrivibrio sp. YE44]
MKKKILATLLLVALSASTLVGCGLGDIEEAKELVSAVKDEAEKKNAESEDENKDSEKEDKKDDKKDDDNSGVIVAKSVDTSSKFAYNVTNAVIGTDPYDDSTFIVYVIGTFENNSDEAMDFSSIVDLTVKQGAFDLDRSYTRSLSKLNYAEIQPGESIPIIMGYKLLSGKENVDIQAVDSRHYAKQVLFEHSYTIEELVNNTNEVIDEYDDYISDDNNDEIGSL